MINTLLLPLFYKCNKPRQTMHCSDFTMVGQNLPWTKLATTKRIRHHYHSLKKCGWKYYFHNEIKKVCVFSKPHRTGRVNDCPLPKI